MLDLTRLPGLTVLSMLDTVAPAHIDAICERAGPSGRAEHIDALYDTETGQWHFVRKT